MDFDITSIVPHVVNPAYGRLLMQRLDRIIQNYAGFKADTVVVREIENTLTPEIKSWSSCLLRHGVVNQEVPFYVIVSPYGDFRIEFEKGTSVKETFEQVFGQTAEDYFGGNKVWKALPPNPSPPKPADVKDDNALLRQQVQNFQLKVRA